MNHTNTQKDIITITRFIEINQPIGKFIICSMLPEDLLAIAKPLPRKYDEESDAFIGIQRTLDQQKLKELESYIKTEDACFPNSIIANLDTSFLLEYNTNEIKIKTFDKDRPDDRAIFIIDGQHRLFSFQESKAKSNFEVIVAIFLGLEIEEQAYLFSIINNKQKKLNASLVQDLNDLFVLETPEKIVHVLTKLFNTSKDSPWKDKIKVLGKDIQKDGKQMDGIMSQYSFAKEIIHLIYRGSKDYFELRNTLRAQNNDRKTLEKTFNKYLEYSRKYVLWKYYADKKDEFIYKSLLSYFKAMKISFATEWGNDEYILTKTTGYIAFMRFFRFILEQEIDAKKLVDQNYYLELFKNMTSNNKIIKSLTSLEYESGGKGQTRLYKDLERAYYESVKD